MNKIKKIHTAFDYFISKTLKNGDLFSYSEGTTCKEISRKAKKLGGIIQYVNPRDPDYKFGNSMIMRVVYPLTNLKLF